jgi:hypothetical protein
LLPVQAGAVIHEVKAAPQPQKSSLQATMRASIAHLGRLKTASIVPLRGYFASTSAIVAACFMEGWWYEYFASTSAIVAACFMEGWWYECLSLAPYFNPGTLTQSNPRFSSRELN